MTTLPRSFWYNPNLPEDKRIIPANNQEHFQVVKDNPELFDLDQNTITQVGGWSSTLMEIIGDLGWIRCNMDRTRDGVPALSMQGDNNEIILKAARQINKIYPLEAILFDTFYEEFSSRSWIELKGYEMDYWLRYGRFPEKDRSSVAQFRESHIKLSANEKLWINPTDNPKNAKVVSLDSSTTHHIEFAYNHPEKMGLSGKIFANIPQEDATSTNSDSPVSKILFDQGWVRYHDATGQAILQGKTLYDVAKALRWLISNNRSGESYHVSGEESDKYESLNGKHEIRKFLKDHRKPTVDEWSIPSFSRLLKKSVLSYGTKKRIYNMVKTLQKKGETAPENKTAQVFNITPRLVTEIISDIEKENIREVDLYENTEIDEWLGQVVNGSWERNPDGTIDVQGYVIIQKETKTIPVQFGNVSGYFDCYNTNIISLEGSPKEVHGYFDCSYTNITSLEGAPRKVGGGFGCMETIITDPYEYRYALLSVIGRGFSSFIKEIDEIINIYGWDGSNNPDSKRKVPVGLMKLKAMGPLELHEKDLMGVPTPSAEEVAKKHGVSIEQIKAQLKKGIKIEAEHTQDKALAKEIALDHLNEFPDYYDRLDKAERPNFMTETLKQVNGKWALVSKSNPKKVLQYYDGPKGKRPSKEWVAKVERRVHSFESDDSLDLPTLNVGDEIKIGRWKNKKATITGFKTDNEDQPFVKTNKGTKRILNFKRDVDQTN